MTSTNIIIIDIKNSIVKNNNDLIKSLTIISLSFLSSWLISYKSINLFLKNDGKNLEYIGILLIFERLYIKYSIKISIKILKPIMRLINNLIKKKYHYKKIKCLLKNKNNQYKK